MALNNRPAWLSFSAVLAILVLVAVFVLVLIGKMPVLEACLFGMLALAILF